MENEKKEVKENNEDDFSQFSLKELDLWYKVTIRDNPKDPLLEVCKKEIEKRINLVKITREK
jgi:hypothetical protein